VLKAGREIGAAVDGSEEPIMLWHHLSERQIDILLAGGAINCHSKHQRTGDFTTDGDLQAPVPGLTPA
jgi:hypothetical protein